MTQLPLWWAIFVLFVSIARTQTVSSAGAIQGSVVDPTGAAIPASRVTARNVNSGATRTTESDGNGHFGFVGLPIGTYTLSAAKEGFSNAEIPAFLLSVGQVATQNIALQVAGVAGKIDVKE